MACTTGCSSGGCASDKNGGCNRLNTFDWLSAMHLEDPNPFPILEISFKDGARKDFYYNQEHLHALTGDTVVVESKNGYDIGRISLSGELVRLQMKKKRYAEDKVAYKILRIASERDIERQKEARSREISTMIRARAIVKTLDLQMKIGDIEYQADNRKATFFYTADGRIDFRELIRHYAKEFKVKIEMRQIGARQESARIGGVGSCGRELCCSTWLSNFKSVSTSAARYQNLAINQAKLSGQCGRLKCCLNYELDTYLDALTNFPKNADKIQAETGYAVLIKTDIFKGLMFYAFKQEKGRNRIFALEVDKVKEILEMNARGEKPMDLSSLHYISPAAMAAEEEEIDFVDDVTGVIELPPEKKKKRNNRNRNSNRNRSNNRRNNQNKSKQGGKPAQDKTKGGSPPQSTSGGNKNQSTENEKSDSPKPSNKNRNRNRNRNQNKNKNKK